MKLDPLTAMLDPILFQQYITQPPVAIASESFDVWKARCRPVPTNPATVERGDE